MPDAEGRIRPISVPACPWHEKPQESYWPTSVRGEELEIQKLRNKRAALVASHRDHGPQIIEPPKLSGERPSAGELADTTARQSGHISDLPVRPAGVKRGEH